MEDDALNGFSESAIDAMRVAIGHGNGTMAQFNHPELGGSGQWMRGGMTMVGSMDSALADRVRRLGDFLASEAPQPANASHDRWWPAHLGAPSASGSQGDSSYAYFPDRHRLAIREGGRVTLYDTTGHFLAGVSQQAPGTGLRFSTYDGLMGTDRFLIVDR